MISISLLDVFSSPVISRNDAATMWRTTTTAPVQHPIGLRREQCIVHGDFFAGLYVAARGQRHFILHPGTRVTGMVHRGVHAWSHFKILHQIRRFLDLDEAIQRMRGLKEGKLGSCHHPAANNADNFAVFYRLTRKHPHATDGRLSDFNSRISPGLWKVGLHLRWTKQSAFSRQICPREALTFSSTRVRKMAI